MPNGAWRAAPQRPARTHTGSGADVRVVIPHTGAQRCCGPCATRRRFAAGVTRRGAAPGRATIARVTPEVLVRKWFIVSAVGRDRPGIVADLAQLVFDCEANLEDSRMTL